MNWVRHSGKLWRSLGRTSDGTAIWPIDEFFARTPCRNSVEQRIRKFYPNGKVEGSFTRGLFIEPMSWRRAKKKMARHEFCHRYRLKGNGIWREDLRSRMKNAHTN